MEHHTAMLRSTSGAPSVGCGTELPLGKPSKKQVETEPCFHHAVSLTVAELVHHKREHAGSVIPTVRMSASPG